MQQQAQNSPVDYATLIAALVKNLSTEKAAQLSLWSRTIFGGR